MQKNAPYGIRSNDEMHSKQTDKKRMQIFFEQ